MNKVLFTIAVLVGFNAAALGPIPNGTYAGTEVCGGKSYSSKMIVSDNSIQWGGQENQFVADSNGLFKVKSSGMMNGNGLGHFTDKGLHYEIVFDYVEKDGSTHAAPGEDTSTYDNGVIHLDASASAGPGRKITCTGDFKATTAATVAKKKGCWLYGKLHPHGAIETTGYQDDGGGHYATWICVDGQWRAYQP